MDLDTLFIFVVLAAFTFVGLSGAGFVLGLIGFRRAQRALTAVALLRAAMADRPATAAEPAARATDVVAAMPTAAPRAEPPPAEPTPAESTPADRWRELAQAPAPPIAAAEPARTKIDIELLLTQRWGVWVGAVALLLSGVFLVRYAVAHALLGPGARCALTALLGLGLVGAAEWLRRRPSRALPLADYAPSALAAGGVGALLVAAYGFGPFYGLVPGFVGFVLLAMASVVGLTLSLRFGWLVGAVGLAAAFATPALVTTAEPSTPGLFAYLLFVSAASWAVVRLTAWTWLGWAASFGGAAWIALAASAPILPDPWVAGLFVPAAVAVALFLLPGAALDHPIGRRFAWVPLLALGLAGLLLVMRDGDATVRLGLLLLAPVAMAKAWSEPRLSWLPLLSAGLSVVTLLVWAVPAWSSADEAIRIEGVVQAVLPGAWAPAAIRPLLWTTGWVAVLHAAAGLFGERRTPRPLSWAALAAAVPVVLLAVDYAQVGQFQARSAWALMAGVLAAGLVTAAWQARMTETPLAIQRAGVHAAGAVAALALGCAIVLDDSWLTVAVALMLPGLAWIEGAADLPPLRRVSLVVGGVVLVRLLLNPSVATYPVGPAPVLNGLLVTFGIPAACFGVAARLFRRRADDVLVAVLEAGACAFGVLLLILEIHQASNEGAWLAARAEFAELGWQVSGLGFVAVLLQWITGRSSRPVLENAWRIMGAGALLGGVALLLGNPFFMEQAIGRGVLLNALLPAYFIPSALAVVAVRAGRVPRGVVGGYAFLSILMWVSAEVRQAFHPGEIELGSTMHDGELWALSGAWLVMAAALMGAGAWLRMRVLRLIGLGMMVLVVAKVFVVDMSGLDGLWRVLSFLGLGLALIGLGAAYRRFARIE